MAYTIGTPIRLSIALASTILTTLTGAIADGASTAAIAVANTAGFPSAGTLQIDNELITYTGTTATTFTGITRGTGGTTGAAHAIGAVVALSADPLSVTIILKLPDGTTVGPYTPSKSGIAAYYYDYEPQHAGAYHYRFSATTPDSASEGIFIVDQSPFL